jgi:hypothetical protein
MTDEIRLFDEMKEAIEQLRDEVRCEDTSWRLMMNLQIFLKSVGHCRKHRSR